MAKAMKASGVGGRPGRIAARAMTLVDSSVWIDHFRGAPTRETGALSRLLSAKEDAAMRDLILAEVLHGFDSDRDPLAGGAVALAAARNHRYLENKGLIIRRTEDSLIATWCIRNEVTLLHHDRDFCAFEKPLGRKVYPC